MAQWKLNFAILCFTQTKPFFNLTVSAVFFRSLIKHESFFSTLYLNYLLNQNCKFTFYNLKNFLLNKSY